MKKLCLILGITLILLTGVSLAHAYNNQAENAVWDNRSVPSLLAVHNSTATKKLTADVDGNLNVNIQAGSVSVALSSITTTSAYYMSTTTGTDGKITGATTTTITIADNVYDFSFLYINTVSPDSYCDIEISNRAGLMYLKDGVSQQVEVKHPAPITFILRNLTASATMLYSIGAQQ